MFKKSVFLSLHLAIVPNFAMVKFDSAQIPVETEDMHSWVQKALSIHIHIKSINSNYKVTIHDKTTILEIKEQIYHMEGIPVDQQILNPIVKKKFTFWRTINGPEIVNDRKKVKEIMHKYNINRFALSIMQEETGK